MKINYAIYCLIIKYIIYNMLQMIKRSNKTGAAAVAGCMHNAHHQIAQSAG